MRSTTFDQIGAGSLRVAVTLLLATVWVSAMLFGLYILSRYLPGLATGEMASWNSTMQPRLYEPGFPTATAGMGIHLAAGGLILVLGMIQFITPLRARWPLLHRVTGRVYLLACALTALGGLAYIVTKGTVGGRAMDFAFAGYGVAMLLCAGMTVRHAVARSLPAHRAWAIRLFALAIGSWLYRMYYALDFASGMQSGNYWHQADFRGSFDLAMNYAFWVPNLLVAQAVILAGHRSLPGWLCATAALAVLVAAVVIGVASYFIGRFAWLPPILSLLGW